MGSGPTSDGTGGRWGLAAEQAPEPPRPAPALGLRAGVDGAPFPPQTGSRKEKHHGVPYRGLGPGLMTRGTLLVLGALIGIAVALPRGQGPGDAAAENLPPLRLAEPGARRGTWGLRPGSKVYCLSHPDLGTGRVVEVKRASRVAFGSSILTLDEDEMRHAAPPQPPADPAAETAAGSPGETPSVGSRSNAPMFPPVSRVTCPSRPELGQGIVIKTTSVFTVEYETGTRIQTDKEIRPALGGPGRIPPHHPEADLTVSKLGRHSRPHEEARFGRRERSHGKARAV
jgi:hypothetical protein